MIYLDRGLLRRTTYTMGEEEIVIAQREILGSNFEIPHRLRDLDPLPFKLWPRRTGATAGVGIAGIAAASILPVWSSASLHLSTFALITAEVAILLAALIATLLPILRFEATAFRSRSGAWLFSVRKVGARDEYETFIGELIRRIEANQESHRPGVD